jgi:endo-1,4-beta-xylanase
MQTQFTHTLSFRSSLYGGNEMFPKPVLTRRRALQVSLGGLATMSAFVKGCASQVQRNPAARDTAGDAINREAGVDAQAPLKEHAAAKGLLYGAACEFSVLSTNASMVAAYEQECAIVVPANELKWGRLRPSRDRFDFSEGDWLADFAQAQGMQFRGHTLLWDRYNPQWLQLAANTQNAEQLLVEHVKTVVEHYAGRMHSWDVVNEVIDAGRPNGLKRSLWQDLLGADYIGLAFRTAAAADPQAMLVLNDNWLEYDSRGARAKQAALLNLLQTLKSQGTPIHALGIQGHLWGHLNNDINYSVLRQFLDDVASLDLKILLTEIDVTDNQLPKDIPTRDRLVAESYQEYLSVVLEQPAVMAVITWGLSDRHTWLSERPARVRQDGAAVRPLPLDAELNRKPAWKAIAQAFDQAPRRNTEG